MPRLPRHRIWPPSAERAALAPLRNSSFVRHRKPRVPAITTRGQGRGKSLRPDLGIGLTAGDQLTPRQRCPRGQLCLLAYWTNSVPVFTATATATASDTACPDGDGVINDIEIAFDGTPVLLAAVKREISIKTARITKRDHILRQPLYGVWPNMMARSPRAAPKAQCRDAAASPARPAVPPVMRHNDAIVAPECAAKVVFLE